MNKDMARAASEINEPFFEDFLIYLKQQGFEVGIEKYVLVQHLFKKIDEKVEPEKLKTLLCPLFVTNRSQQEKFYNDFDNYLAYLETIRSQTNEKGKPEPPQIKWYARWSWLISPTPLGMLALLTLVAAFVIYNILSPTSITNINVDTTAPVSASRQIPTLIPTVERKSTEQESFTSPQWYILVGIILPLTLMLLYALYRFAKYRKVLKNQHTKQPPYEWILSPRMRSPPAIYNSPEFFNAVRLLRQRQTGEFEQLDIPATVAATIKVAGYPSLRYKFAGKAPEYVILINRLSMRDHQSQLFSQMVKALRRENVFVAQYFYEDLRICFDETRQQHIYLSELQSKYPTHRLLIFSSGAELLDPLTGELAGWTSMLLNWNELTLLTPELPAGWGWRELALAKKFVVLPATIAGLAELITTIKPDVPTAFRNRKDEDFVPVWRESIADSENRSEISDFINQLHKYLGDEVFQWLCACAVYPGLDWNLTLTLGLEINPELINERNLLKLIRLPGFRQGAIPENLRWHLVQRLSSEIKSKTRETLIKLLESDAPQWRSMRQTYAADDYELNLLTQLWRLRSDNRLLLRRLLKKIKQLPLSLAFRDTTIMHFLQDTRTLILNIILPGYLRKFLFINGIPSLGFKNSVSYLAFMLLIPVMWSIAYFTKDSSVPRIIDNTNPPTITIPTTTPISLETTEVTPALSPTTSPTTSPTRSLAPNALPSPDQFPCVGETPLP